MEGDVLAFGGRPMGGWQTSNVRRQTSSVRRRASLTKGRPASVSGCGWVVETERAR